MMREKSVKFWWSVIVIAAVAASCYWLKVDKNLIEIDTGKPTVFVPDGKFTLFGNSFEVDAFNIFRHEVTVSEYADIMEYNPTRHDAHSDFPVVNVSWRDAVEFCNALSEEDDLEQVYEISEGAVSADFSKNGWRLPTKIEWYWAAVGAAADSDYAYSGSDAVEDVAWYIKNSGERSHEVEQKEPNRLGIYDMTGNVSEWCWDYFWDWKENGKNYAGKNPSGPSSGKSRSIAGGFYGNSANLSRVTEYQDQAIETVKQAFYGFRPVRNSHYIAVVDTDSQYRWIGDKFFK